MQRKLWILLFKQIAKPFFYLVILSAIGTVGYIVIDNYPIIDAFYMTIITIGTVGFGEVHPLSPIGRLFTSALIISSLGLVAYYISIITRVLVDGDWIRQMQKLKLLKQIKAMEDHVIVCGYGRNGRQACHVLKQNNIKFAVVESRQAHVAEAAAETPLIINGDATKDEVLLDAGILKAKALISALPDDADNLFAVLTARQLNPNVLIISRASFDNSVSKLKIAGANNVIMPDKLGGANMASLVLIPDVHEFISLLTTVQTDQFRIAELSLQRSFNLGEADIWKKTGCTVIGVKCENGHYQRNPSPNFDVKNTDRLIVMGSKTQIGAAIKIINN